MSFTIALTNVLVMLFYIIPGFVLRKLKMVSEKELGTTSSILLYAGTPFLIINSFLKMEFSYEMLKQMGLFFLVTFALQGLFLCILMLVFRKRFKMVRTRVITIASALGNVGFFGIPVVSGLFPGHPEAACFGTMYMMSMNLIVFTVGVFFLTGDRKYMSVKHALLNPSALGLYVAVPLYFLQAQTFLPEALLNAVSALAGMTAPLCMIILGIRLASQRLKPIFTDWPVYGAVVLKLLVFPLFVYGAVILLPVSESFKASALILSAVPCGSVVLNLAEMHHTEQELASHVLLLTSLLCFLTIPLLALLL